VTRPAIRAAGSGDATALAGLRHEFRSDLAPATEAEAAFLERCTGWMARRLAAGSPWRCWVAETGTTIVGTVWLQLIDKLPNPVAEPERHGYVSSLYVRPAHRGAGLGSELLGACLQECERLELDTVVLWPTPASRSLYLRHGFAARDDLLARRLWTFPDHGGAG
jgi:ribosomal protein S18 acetylase RimI-like enzyme